MPLKYWNNIKTLPLNLLDFYFEQRGLPFEKISYLSRMSPERVLKDEILKEKLEDVYDFACTNQMTRAVIPLLLDAETGKGLYVLGEAYLQQWNFQESEQEKVEEIGKMSKKEKRKNETYDSRR